jgi:ABC-type transporter Mla subunit MlaD
MAVRDEGAWRALLGLVVVIVGVLLFVALLLANQRDGSLREQVTIYTDFRTISGLRRDSPVLLAGVEVGRVKAIDFVNRKYTCDPLTEDLGRHGSGRTNTCDEALFCAPNGLCADLESYAAKGIHGPCLSNDDCIEDEVCVTGNFLRRAKGVYWGGPEGLCARFTTDHRRVQVALLIPADKLEVVGADSVATVGSAGVLGDQQVNITPGAREPLGEDHRIQSEASFSEQIAEFRERFDRLSDKVDTSLSGISSTFAELNDARTIDSVKQTLAELDTTTSDIRAGRGTIGALLGSPEYEREFTETLAKARDTAGFVDGVLRDANTRLAKVDRETEPRVAELRKDVGSIRAKFAQLDPAQGGTFAKLLRDPSGELLASVNTSLANLRTIARIFADTADRIERGEGSIGALLGDSKVYDDMDRSVVEITRDWRVRLLLWLLHRGRK